MCPMTLAPTIALEAWSQQTARSEAGFFYFLIETCCFMALSTKNTDKKNADHELMV